MKSGAAAIVLTTLIFSAVGYFLWLDSQESSNTTLRNAPPQSGQPLPSKASRVTPSPPAPGTGDVHKCIAQGSVVYQDSPCTRTVAAPLDGGTLSVVSLPPATLQVALASSNRAETGVIANPGSRKSDPNACPSLRKRIKTIDSAARRRSTNHLTEERRKARERMASLGCSEFD